MIEEILNLIPKSEGLKGLFPFSLLEWREKLKELDEETLTDFLHLLKEEIQMLAEVEHKADKRHQMNLTRYLQRMEGLRLKLEQLNNSK